jgi:YHS domain-containing protein
MNIRTLGLAIALTAALVPGVAVAQLEAHQAGAPQASAEMVQCARVQPVIDRIITAATARLELARQSNKPEEMRAAVDHLEAALRDIRVQLAPCSAVSSKAPNQSPADPHAGHAAGQQPGKQMDPVSGLAVDPATAPKTIYQGQTYYFGSEQTRKEFLENPGKYAKKPKG